MKIKTIALILVCAAAMTACSSSKTVLPYFVDLQKAGEGTLPTMEYLPTVQPDDELFISVTSVSPEATAIYNLPNYTLASREVLTTSSSPRSATYVVDSKGNINFPVLGSLHVAGMNVDQITDMLTKKISADVTDPVVTVRLVNFKVVVAGEVADPKTIDVNRNRITILDALAEAGDLTPYGERSNILVIREENGERKFGHVDLNSAEALNSPYYYLQQNDYVYVAPNKVRQANSKYNQDNAYKLSVISTVVSASSVIASLIIALVVK